MNDGTSSLENLLALLCIDPLRYYLLFSKRQSTATLIAMLTSILESKEQRANVASMYLQLR